MKKGECTKKEKKKKRKKGLAEFFCRILPWKRHWRSNSDANFLTNADGCPG